MIKGICKPCPKCDSKILFLDRTEPGDEICIFCGKRVYEKLEEKKKRKG